MRRQTTTTAISSSLQQNTSSSSYIVVVLKLYFVRARTGGTIAGTGQTIRARTGGKKFALTSKRAFYSQIIRNESLKQNSM